MELSGLKRAAQPFDETDGKIQQNAKRNAETTRAGSAEINKGATSAPLGINHEEKSDGNRCLDGRVRIVTFDFKVFETVIEQRCRLALDHQLR